MTKTALTIQLVIKNHEDKIEKALDSISSLGANILVADIGSQDNTPLKCLKYKAKIVKLSLNNDMSEVRNSLMSYSTTKWNFYLDPWEFLLNGKEIILESIKENNLAYKFNILQDDIITKQIRLWNRESGIRFKNPVFETLSGDAINSDVYLSSESSSIDVEILEKWLSKNPFSNDPIYYKSCYELTKKNWDSFLNYSGLYLHQEKSDKKSVFMTYYYRSMVNCYIKKNQDEAIRNLIPCLAKNPVMAEFWCLLGDIFYNIKNYDKAKSFYNNAIILGSRRLNSDDWPLEISKYKEYPESMIKSCESIKNNTKFYVATKLNPVH